MKHKIKIFYSEKCNACPPALRIVRRLKEIFRENLEVKEVNLDTEEGRLEALLDNVMADGVIAIPTIDVNGKVRMKGVYPRLKEDIINALADSPNIKKRVVEVVQLESGEICRLYIDKDHENRIHIRTFGNEECKKLIKEG